MSREIFGERDRRESGFWFWIYVFEVVWFVNRFFLKRGWFCKTSFEGRLSGDRSRGQSEVFFCQVRKGVCLCVIPLLIILRELDRSSFECSCSGRTDLR
jgi:hypothetical protein